VARYAGKQASLAVHVRGWSTLTQIDSTPDRPARAAAGPGGRLAIAYAPDANTVAVCTYERTTGWAAPIFVDGEVDYFYFAALSNGRLLVIGNKFEEDWLQTLVPETGQTPSNSHERRTHTHIRTHQA